MSEVSLLKTFQVTYSMNKRKSNTFFIIYGVELPVYLSRRIYWKCHWDSINRSIIFKSFDFNIMYENIVHIPAGIDLIFAL